jgi:hypothetical protein
MILLALENMAPVETDLGAGWVPNGWAGRHLCASFTQPDSLIPQPGSPLGWDRIILSTGLIHRGTRHVFIIDENENCVIGLGWNIGYPLSYDQKLRPFFHGNGLYQKRKCTVQYNEFEPSNSGGHEFISDARFSPFGAKCEFISKFMTRFGSDHFK